MSDEPESATVCVKRSPNRGLTYLDEDVVAGQGRASTSVCQLAIRISDVSTSIPSI
jgi:hypothetical protein